MSIEIKVGREFPVAGAKFGNSSRGEYYKVDVKAEKGWDKIQVWATNPKDAKDIIGNAKVTKIAGVKLGAHLYNGKWYTDYTVDAELAQGNQETVMFEQVELGGDDDLPFA